MNSQDNSSEQFLDELEYYSSTSPLNQPKSVLAEQENYIRQVKRLNEQNYRLTDKWTYEGHDEYLKYNQYPEIIASVLRKVEQFKLTKISAFQSLSLLTMSVLLFALIIIPILRNSVPFVLGADSKKGVSVSAKFGNVADLTKVKRQNPSYAQNVTLKIRGVLETFNTTEATVKDVLKFKNITIGYDEAVYPSLDKGVSDDELIIVNKFSEKTLNVKETVDFETKIVEEPTIRKGVENVVAKGKTGESYNSYLVRTVDDLEVSRVNLDSVPITNPLPKIIMIGTGEILSNGSLISAGSSEAKSFALNYIREIGFEDSEFSCLELLWQRESGWRTNAGNLISGAYGIPQALPGSKMSAFGDDWRTNYETQIKWGLNYVKTRYSTPCSAWAYWQVHHWY